MKICLTIVLFAVAAVIAQGARAEGNAADVTDMQALQKAVQIDKRAFVAATLALTAAEAKKFWPLYDAYQRALNLSNRKRAVAVEGLVARDKPLSDLYAKSLANDLIAADESEIAARRKLQNRMIKAIPPKKAARYLHLEAKIRAAQAYDIAVAIPLVK